MKLHTCLSFATILLSTVAIALLTSSMLTNHWIDGYIRFNSKAMDKQLNTSLVMIADEFVQYTNFGLHNLCGELNSVRNSTVIFKQVRSDTYDELLQTLKNLSVIDSSVVEMMDNQLRPLHEIYVLLFVTIIGAVFAGALSLLRTPCLKTRNRYRIFVVSTVVTLCAVLFGLATLIYAEVKLSISNKVSLDEIAVLQKVLPTVDVKKIILEIMHYDFHRGYSYIIAWCGELALVLSLLITIVELYVLKKKVDAYNRFYDGKNEVQCSYERLKSNQI